VNPYELNAARRADFRNHHVGFVFQDHCLLESCTAIDNVLLPALASGRVKDSLVERARSLLERVGLKNRTSHLPAELSGGERQRVAVARALLLCPTLLLADEPTGQLDSNSAVQVIDLLHELVDETGSLLCIVTHDESVAERVAGCPQGRRLRLTDGHLIP
jgi:lipoprotein-releasing system ATP-binding protein